MYERIERWASTLAGFLMFLLMALTFVDVCGRNLFNRPINGASELTEIMLAAVIFLMLPHVALRNQHIVIDIIDQVASHGVQVALDILAALLGAVMFSVIAWQMWIQGDKALGYGDSSPTLHVPYGPILYAIAVLSGITALAFLLTIPAAIKAPQHEHHPEQALI